MVLMPPESPSPKCPDASQVPVFPPLLPSGGQNPGDSGVLGGAVRHSGSATSPAVEWESWRWESPPRGILVARRRGQGPKQRLDPSFVHQ
jgi:hypothetical protein